MPEMHRTMLMVPKDFETFFLTLARIEPRCRSEEATQQGLEARIADPLWMLARQWQMGEFLGEDNGSPIRVQVNYRVDPIDKVKLARAGNPVAVQSAPPLEAYVERERIRLNYRVKVQIGQQFERFLRRALNDQAISNQAICAYRKPGVLGITLPTDLTGIDDATQQFVQLMQGRAIDGQKLLKDNEIIGEQDLPDISSIVSLDTAKLKQALDDLKDWYAAVYNQPASPQETAWKPQELEYEFSLQGRTGHGAAGDNATELVAPDYRNGDLDWYSCDLLKLSEPKPQKKVLKYRGRSPARAAMVSRILVQQYSRVKKRDTLLIIKTTHPHKTIQINAPDDGIVTNIYVSANEQIKLNQLLVTLTVPNRKNVKTAWFNPTRIGFAGKPNERWWAMEDYNVDLAKLSPNTTDLSKLLLMEFALVYADDWCQFPLEIPRGTLARIVRLKVHNVFGEETEIDPAIEPGATESDRWEIFTLANHSDPNSTSDAFLFIPPTLGDREESPAIEEVRLMRDEGANMVFAVEHIVQNGLGKAIEGFEAQTERYMRQQKKAVEEKLMENEQSLSTSDLMEEEREVLLEEQAKLIKQLHEILNGLKAETEGSGKYPRYRIAGTVPDNWIPYVNVRLADSRPTGVRNVSDSSVRLRQANMLRQNGTEQVTPMTRILNNEDVSEQSLTWLNEEAVTRMGTKVLLTRQRMRWVDGSTYVWWGRKVKTGRGEGSGGLRFDFVKPNSG